MKIFISADIEGIGSVVRSEHSSVQGREYALARRLMTLEVNAAIEAAYDAGADEVMVADAHNVGLNLLPEELDDRALLVMGSPRPLAMMEGIDRGMDAALFIGYHGASGAADAAIAHIFSGRVAGLSFNNIPVGETGLNAFIAGYYNVPVIMLSGDTTACNEAAELIPGIETAAVKESIGAYAGICYHPRRCREMIYKSAEKAINSIPMIAPLIIKDQPVKMEIRFTTASTTDRALRLPGTKRLDGLSLSYEAGDYLQAYKAFIAIADIIELVPFI